jgi:hypothetical protein
VPPGSRVRERPLGITALVVFFSFGAAVAGLTVGMLLAPGAWADAVWRLKPSAPADFRAMGAVAVPLMLVVAAACAGAAIGLWGGRRWGYRLAIGVLGVNLVGDLANGLIRHDWRTLIGIPVGGAMLLYLTRPNIRHRFPARENPV